MQRLALQRLFSKRRMRRLSVPVFAAFAALTIQIKYWVYYGHDCLFLNPYRVTKTQPHQAHAHESTSSAQDHHNHDSCAICQSFQQLTTAIFEPAPEPLHAAQLIKEALLPLYQNPSYSSEGQTEAFPRAPPV